jgi:hypothetical protein
MEKKESFNQRQDTAQETPVITSPEFKTVYRNELFDRIVATGMEFYVALLIDNPPYDPLNNLFCGNVGEINNDVIMENENKDCYYVSFIDCNNKEENFSDCVVNKKYLLPLFCFDPATDEKIETIPQQNENLLTGNMSINSIRNQWEQHEVHNISTLQLQSHKKVENRFDIGQFVTIQFDFKQEMSNNEAFTIQAGQIGIISKTQALETDCVEVTFCSMSLGKLIKKSKELSFLSLDQDTVIVTNSSWERKICIHKNFLFPLYIEQLQ